MDAGVDARTLLRRAWEFSYLEPEAARAEASLALDLVEPGSEAAGWCFWLMALADARQKAAASARGRLQLARCLFQQHGVRRGLALCEELEAMLALNASNPHLARGIHAGIDEADDPGYEPFDQFLAHNLRAITASRLGEHEEALVRSYAAREAAEASQNSGAHATMLCNLGGLHQELFDLDDARRYSEAALELARRCGARRVVTTAAAQLIVIHHAAGREPQALEMARFLIEHPELQAPAALTQVSVPLALAYFAAGDIDRAEAWLEGGSNPSSATDGNGVAFWAWLSARCLMTRGEHQFARDLAERTLLLRRGHELPYHQMKLMRAAADACEALGDVDAALRHEKQAQQLYEQLIAHAQAARTRALQAEHEYARVERELAEAQRFRQEAETDRRRLADLNRALEAKVAENELLQARLREQVRRDPLTGLHNRRYLFEMAPGLLELARQQRQPLSVVLIDIDHFKSLNDSYGHAAGDAVLQRMAALLGSQLRHQDIACRYGGEEFVVVMPELDAEAAAAAIDRLLHAFHDEPVEFRRRTIAAGSFSAGVASFPVHGDRLEHLLGRADKALYRAKESGRARVEHAEHTGFATLT
ncbi:MAG: diguanylate cyclase [Rubrivivax sp.]|nr:diguanylate cyclase [Rubrivivax sp.]